MEKMLCLFIMLCSGLLEVRCLQCYVCDNCPKVTEEELQTCGMQTTPGPSTIATTTTQPTTTIEPTTPSTMGLTPTPTTITSTTTEPTTILTKTTIEPIATSTTNATDLKDISTTTTDAYTIATITTAKPKTNYTTSAPSLTIISTTIATESTTNSIATTAELVTSLTITTEPVTPSTSTIEPITTSTTTTGPTKITTKPAIIPTIFSKSIEPTIPTEPMTTSTTTTTESSAYFTTITSEPTNIQTATVAESVISYLTSTKPGTTFTSIPFISTLPTTLAEPIVNFTTEPRMDTVPISATNYPKSTNNTKAVDDTNATYNFPQRRPRSLHKDCACNNEKICDCLMSKQRSKRYALRGLDLSKEGVRYVCIVDKFKVNETEVVKRGCAIKEEDETTSCVYSGLGEDCKICDSDQCNGASIVQISAVLMFIICCIHNFSVEYIVN